MSHSGVTRRLKTCGLLQGAREKAQPPFPQMHRAIQVLAGQRCGVGDRPCSQPITPGPGVVHFSGRECPAQVARRSQGTGTWCCGEYMRGAFIGVGTAQ
jgi:hypothetical protein